MTNIMCLLAIYIYMGCFLPTFISYKPTEAIKVQNSTATMCMQIFLKLTLPSKIMLKAAKASKSVQLCLWQHIHILFSFYWFPYIQCNPQMYRAYTMIDLIINVLTYNIRQNVDSVLPCNCVGTQHHSAKATMQQKLKGD